jgi:glutathione S-transferase
MATPYKLITIPPSHYCEKARWALDHVGAVYRQQGHPPLLHFPHCKKAGGRSSAPVLVTDEGAYPDSTDILQFLDGEFEDDARLYPKDPGERQRVDDLEEQFDEKLGPHTRRVAYHHLLPHRKLVMGTVLFGVSRTERVLFKTFFPVIRFLMRKGMNITEASADRSLDRIRGVFREVEGHLADGRSHLVGGRFTAADLTFAAMAAPVLLPRNYGSPLPSLADLPSALLPLIEEMRSSPAGEFGLKIYRDHR